MKVLVLGSTGLLGQALIKEIKKRKFNYVGVALKNADINVDITDDDRLCECINTTRPDVLINTCAIVNHKICDDDILAAYKVNARPSSILVKLAKEYNFKYVYISTDGYFVDDRDKAHDENAPMTFLNEYARTKFLGEAFSLTDENALVIRTNIVGFRGVPQMPTFVEWAIQMLKNGEKMTLFDDYFTSSISVALFSKALFDLILKDINGRINLASSSVSSKKEFIEELAKQFSFSLSNTKTGSVSSLSSKRADSLGLDVSKAERILGYKLPNLQAVIAQLKEEYSHV